MKTEQAIYEHYKAWRLSIGILEPPVEEAYRAVRDSLHTVEEQEAQNRLESLINTEDAETEILVDEDGNELFADRFQPLAVAASGNDEEEDEVGIDEYDPHTPAYVFPSEAWWTELLSHPFQFGTKQWWAEMSRIGRISGLMEKWINKVSSKTWVKINGPDVRLTGVKEQLGYFQDYLQRLGRCQ